MQKYLRYLFASIAAAMSLVAASAPGDDRAQVVLHLLDYVAVEYPEFVQAGRVLDEAEYQEQVEFSQKVAEDVAGFPQNPRRSELASAARQLAELIAARAEGPNVASHARELQRNLVAAYDIRIAPQRSPVLATGAALYGSACASCHGKAGAGNGPLAQGLDPKPTDFTSRERQLQRSVLGLFNTITLGVDGTGMTSFSNLSADDRWALAFYVARMSATEEERARGERLWQSAAPRAAFSSLSEVVAATPAEVLSRSEDAFLVLTYLRGNPGALAPSSGSDPLAVTVSRLRESEKLYRAGQQDAAYQAAISAYLDGFELAEAWLHVRDRNRIEQAMTSFRSLLKSDVSADEASAAAAALIDDIESLQAAMNSDHAASGAEFVSSLIIILREGLEAMLVIVAIAAFLIRSERRDALAYVHFGWIGALVAGIATWIVSSALFTISGAQREVTEGVTALLAAAVLLYAGYWLHSKSHATRWQSFIRGQVSGALSKGQLWGLAVVSFLAVYREVFETVLFMQALWIQAEPIGRSALVGGAVTGAVLLALAAWLISRFSARLPLGLFFGLSAGFLAVLAVVFAGRGVAALQAAGKLPLDPVRFFEGLPALGLYPNVQGLAVQLLFVALIIAGFIYGRSVSRRTH